MLATENHAVPAPVVTQTAPETFVTDLTEPLVEVEQEIELPEVGGVAAADLSIAFRGADTWSPARPALYVLRVDIASIEPSRARVSMRTRMRSPSRSLPKGPPAQASGLMWPMQAPVDTPENRPSVSNVTRRPLGRYFNAEVTW